MRIRIVTPAPAGSLKGNRVTAMRWARLLRELGHRVWVAESYRGEACDCLVALHARKSAASVEVFRRAHPHLPVLVALTGTDVYQDLAGSPEAQRCLELATRIIVLQPLAARELRPHQRIKVSVVIQSAPAPRHAPSAANASESGAFDVCVLGHLRSVKDPFRAAEAARLLPPESRIRIIQLGAATNPAMEDNARAEMASNPRYRWLGERPRGWTLRRLACCRLLALTSVLEGGANVISEALAAGVPIVSSRIPGSIGLLGEEYPGYFPVGDTAALAAMLRRAEADATFYASLKAHCAALAPLVAPERERDTWREILSQLAAPQDDRSSRRTTPR